MWPILKLSAPSEKFPPSLNIYFVVLLLSRYTHVLHAYVDILMVLSSAGELPSEDHNSYRFLRMSLPILLTVVLVVSYGLMGASL